MIDIQTYLKNWEIILKNRLLINMKTIFCCFMLISLLTGCLLESPETRERKRICRVNKNNFEKMIENFNNNPNPTRGELADLSVLLKIHEDQCAQYGLDVQSKLK